MGCLVSVIVIVLLECGDVVADFWGIAGTQAAEGSLLHAFIDGKSRWNSTWEPDVWHNNAYEIVSILTIIGFEQILIADRISARILLAFGTRQETNR